MVTKQTHLIYIHSLSDLNCYLIKFNVKYDLRIKNNKQRDKSMTLKKIDIHIYFKTFKYILI